MFLLGIKKPETRQLAVCKSGWYTTDLVCMILTLLLCNYLSQWFLYLLPDQVLGGSQGLFWQKFQEPLTFKYGCWCSFQSGWQALDILYEHIYIRSWLTLTLDEVVAIYSSSTRVKILVDLDLRWGGCYIAALQGLIYGLTLTLDEVVAI